MIKTGCPFIRLLLHSAKTTWTLSTGGRPRYLLYNIPGAQCSHRHTARKAFPAAATRPTTTRGAAPPPTAPELGRTGGSPRVPMEETRPRGREDDRSRHRLLALETSGREGNRRLDLPPARDRERQVSVRPVLVPPGRARQRSRRKSTPGSTRYLSSAGQGPDGTSAPRLSLRRGVAIPAVAGKVPSHPPLPRKKRAGRGRR
jgi:hypothetical protein